MNIPVTRPYIGIREKKSVNDVLESGWLTQGSEVTRFENSVADWTGARHAVAFSNCTTALHVALLLHGIGPGDEVIVPSYTWIATANAVWMVGARPVFADIDIDTFNIRPSAIEGAIRERTKAIMPVHQFGLPADMDEIGRIAARHRLAIIEDAACALGSRYGGKWIGNMGHTTCFSFHPRKIITTGEGGMLVTSHPDLAARARVLLNHGASISDSAKHKANTVQALLSEEFHEIGYNYRMTNLQGALGVVQMEMLKEIIELRRKRADRYTAAFTGMKHIIPPTVPAGRETNWQSYAVRVGGDSPLSRDFIAQALLDAGIACRPAYMACHLQPVYRKIYPQLDLPDTQKALEKVIMLPLYPQMTDDEQDYVIDQIVKMFREGGS